MYSSSATRSQPFDVALNPAANSGEVPILVGIDEAARMLGVSSRTVWTLTDSDSLPHLRIGRRVLYPVDALRRWTAERTRGGASAK
ncbi:MAG: helix-turn-helix domain-containing protein [Planctomycetes bacterium]|nr:helix-turn-helix domain-containing protein [Planctomycetota bacterium]